MGARENSMPAAQLEGKGNPALGFTNQLPATGSRKPSFMTNKHKPEGLGRMTNSRSLSYNAYCMTLRLLKIHPIRLHR